MDRFALASSLCAANARVMAGQWALLEQRATTDAQGVYRFTDMKTHIGQLEARTNDGRKSERRQLRLWFRSQDTEVLPLIVEAPRA